MWCRGMNFTPVCPCDFAPDEGVVRGGWVTPDEGVGVGVGVGSPHEGVVCRPLEGVTSGGQGGATCPCCDTSLAALEGVSKQRFTVVEEVCGSL